MGVNPRILQPVRNADVDQRANECTLARNSLMGENVYRPKTVRMWALLAPALAYLFWVTYLPTGVTLFDGSVGVILGLYICSLPAANGIDLFFVQPGRVRRLVSGWSGFGWLMLNALVMFVGLIVIVFGAARFTVVAV